MRTTRASTATLASTAALAAILAASASWAQRAPAAVDAALRLRPPAIGPAPLTALPSNPRPERKPVVASAKGGGPKPGEALPAKPRSGRVGYSVRDAATGRLLEERDADGLYLPASLTKTPTALYALDALGDDHRFETVLYASGPIVNGELKGDLILVGDGDPTLDTADLAQMVKELKALGVTGVSGRLLYDAGALPTEEQIEPGQPVHAAYNPSISGLNLNFNRVLMRWEKQKGGAYDLNLFAHAQRWSTPAQNVLGGLLGPDEGRIFRYHRESTGDESWRVSRKVLGKRGSRWLPVQAPGRYSAVAFRTVAAELELLLPMPQPGAISPGAKKLVTSTSKPLRDIVRDMLKYSTNLTAEVVGLVSSKSQRSGDLSLASSGARMSLWAAQTFKTKPGALQFLNHSGLTSASRASPGAMTSLLIAAAKEDAGFPDLLPRHRVKGLHKAEIRAKTGTMYYGRGLSGFLNCDNGVRLAFTYMHSDLKGRADLDAEMDPESTYVPRAAKHWLGRARGVERGLLVRWSKRYCG